MLLELGPEVSFVAMGGTGQALLAPQLLSFAVILGIFYVIIFMPMRKQRQKVQDFQDGLKVGEKVVTTGGIYGVITRVSDKSIQLQVADNPKVRIEIARASVGGYQGQDPVVSEPGS